jgi:DNA-binding PadR family transcriptional regulator
MASQARSAGEAVFGSGTRAKVLGYLAQSATPATGYAIAKALEIAFSNVYDELKNLEEWQIVASQLDLKGGKRYRLIEEDLRRFLLRRLRILASDEWFSTGRVADRRARLEDVKGLQIRVGRSRIPKKDRPFRMEFERSPGKDRALKRVKAATGGTP